MAKKSFIPIPPMADLPPAENIDAQEVLEKYLSGEIDLICVLGPTASGKTRYAVQLARQINELLGQMGDSGLSDVRFAHPTTALRLWSPRFRAAGGTVLRSHSTLTSHTASWKAVHLSGGRAGLHSGSCLRL